MPYTLSIHINPECLNFLNHIQPKKNISTRQALFIENINGLHSTVKKLKSLSFFEFTQKQEKEIKRGTFYALTHSLREQSKKQPITLPDLQRVLNNEFHINAQSSINFILMSLLEPHSVPLSLSALAYSILNGEGCWSNEYSPTDAPFKYSLQATSASNPCSGNIIFTLQLDLKTFNPESKNSLLGSAQIQFIINNNEQIKLLPLEIEFHFTEKKALTHFKKELGLDYPEWIFSYETYWKITDLWVLPGLIGCLFSLIVIVSLLALSLTPIFPLLLPLLGLVLGLCLASLMHVFAQTQIKKYQENFQRPIHLFEGKPAIQHTVRNIQTTTFFDYRHLINPAMQTETRCKLNPSGM